VITILACVLQPSRTVRRALLFTLLFVDACGIGSMVAAQNPAGRGAEVQRHQPVSTFVRRIHQDRRGHYWFGTNGDGILRWDGSKLESFSIKEGFGGVAVRGIVEDEKGHVWFGTERGLTRFDGCSFVNFRRADGLVGDDVWALLIDRKGVIWTGTAEGVSRFDGKAFTTFHLPESPPDPTRGVTGPRMVHCIMEDRRGRLWFATSGGAYVFDEGTLRNISEADGLCNDVVNCILEAKDGSIWFATHHNGVCRFDGTTFTHFGMDAGVEGTEAWDLFEDSRGNIWFPIENAGVYRYDGTSFDRLDETKGLTSNAIQCTFEDDDGRIWLGGHRGLFRCDGDRVVPVGRNGPLP